MILVLDPTRTPGDASDPQPARTAHPRGGPLVLAALAVVATAVVATDTWFPPVRPLAGLFLLVGLPTYLVHATRTWVRGSSIDAVLCSFAAVLLAVVLGGLVINEVLPLVGVDRPLDRVPVLVATDVALLALAGSRWRRLPAERELRARAVARLRRLPVLDRRVVGVGILLVVMSTAGAIRLNNGAGGGVTVAMLCLAALVIVGLVRWRRRLRRGTVVVAVYLLALALLYMTSLRGWGVIGHDSETEFYVYRLTKDAGSWQMDAFRSAYNACLSINILPTVLSNMTGLPGAYVFKLLFPLIFALCPVIVFLIARRFASALVAVLAAVYFVAFPTFFTDMPFLNRQAIAFVFLGMIILVVTNARWTVRRRRVWVAALSAGVVLAHYSTTYVFIGIIAVALLAGLVATGGSRLLGRWRTRPSRTGRNAPRVLGVVNIGIFVLLAAAWTGPATHTGGQVEETTTRLVGTLLGGGAGQQSSDVAYSVVGGPGQTREQRLRAYVDSTFTETAEERAVGGFLRPDALARYPSPLAEPDELPLTAASRVLHGAGVDVEWFNSAMRQGAAQLLQVFVVVGLLFVLLGRARGLRASRELFLLAVAAFLVVALLVLLPTLSVDYGVLRAFQQALFLLAPFLAVGSIGCLGWLGPRRARIAASGVAVWFFLCLTGVIPQMLGAYGPQLHLNNAGEYYDLYYTHPEEDAAADWLEREALAAGRSVVQTQVAGRFLYSLGPRMVVERTIHPARIRPGAYVLLGTSTVTTGRATVSFGGDRLSYEYPFGLLDQTKDLVYDDGRARIYQ